jgi:hypothetical protein
MSWHEEIVVIQLNDDKGEKISDLELTKAEFLTIQTKAVEEGKSLEDYFCQLLVDYCENLEE